MPPAVTKRMRPAANSPFLPCLLSPALQYEAVTIVYLVPKLSSLANIVLNMVQICLGLSKNSKLLYCAVLLVNYPCTQIGLDDPAAARAIGSLLDSMTRSINAEATLKDQACKFVLGHTKHLGRYKQSVCYSQPTGIHTIRMMAKYSL